jgi:hypothetical protein
MLSIDHQQRTAATQKAKRKQNMNFENFTTKRLVRIIKRMTEWDVIGDNVMMWDDSKKQFIDYCTTENKELLAAIVAYNEAVNSKEYNDHLEAKEEKFKRGEIDLFTYLMKDEMTPVHPDFVKYKKK